MKNKNEIKLNIIISFSFQGFRYLYVELIFFSSSLVTFLIKIKIKEQDLINICMFSQTFIHVLLPTIEIDLIT